MARLKGLRGPSRVFAGGLAALFALASFGASLEATGERASAAPKGHGSGGGRRPNVLVILTDDQRERGTMGVMDRTTRLFREAGVRFSRAFTPTPVCCPARATVFTGQYVHNHELFTNGERDLPQFETVQRYLDESGYKTGIFGKYLNAWNIEEDPPHFDKWSIFKNSSQVYGTTSWNEQGDVKDIVEYPTDYMHSRRLSSCGTSPKRRIASRGSYSSLLRTPTSLQSPIGSTWTPTWADSNRTPQPGRRTAATNLTT